MLEKLFETAVKPSSEHHLLNCYFTNNCLVIFDAKETSHKFYHPIAAANIDAGLTHFNPKILLGYQLQPRDH